MQTTRRGFIKGMGALGAAAQITVAPTLIASAVNKANAAEAAKGPVVDYVKSTCVHCVNFCGINVKRQNGVIRAIYPDEARKEFYNDGICPKGVSGVFNTYNPYRVKKPLKRTNPKKGVNEDPGWVEISWEEALKTIEDKLKKIRSDNPAKMQMQWGHGKYLIKDGFLKAWGKAFGTPNMTHRTTVCEAARHVADEITWGGHAWMPDLKQTELMLVFGANPYEAEQWARWLDHQILDARERGMKMVYFDPRHSSAAAKSDVWVPIKPGKDVLFCLGMAKQLIEMGYIDEEFLVEFTNATALVGPDGRTLKDDKGNELVWDTVSKSAKPYVEGVRPALRGSYTVNGRKVSTAFDVFYASLADITPEYVERESGVPAGMVVSLAKEWGEKARIGSTVVIDGEEYRYRPVVAHTFRGMAAKEYGVQNWRSGLILMMLVGAMDAVGSQLLHHPNPDYKSRQVAKCEYPPKRIDLQESVFFPYATHNIAQQAALTLLDREKYGLEYEPEMTIFYATNRPFSTSEALKQFEGYAKTFNVVIEIYLTDVTQVADIVLPDVTYLEDFQVADTRWTADTSHKAIRQPVVKDRVYGVKYSAQEFFIEMAKRVGFYEDYIKNINANFKLKDYPLDPKNPRLQPRDFVEAVWKQDTKGKPFSYALEHAFAGKHLKPEDMYHHGIEKLYKGPGKPKIYLYADQLLGTFDKVAEIKRKHNIAAIDLERYKVALSPVPTKEHAFPTPHREAKDYPLYLTTYKRMYRNQAGNMSFNPILNNLGPDTDHNFMLIQKQTAKKLGIRNGDEVIIETRVGKARAVAKVVEGQHPDVVSVSYHYGNIGVAYPDWARKGTWINPVLELHPDLIAGMNSFNDTKCKVYKA